MNQNLIPRVHGGKDSYQELTQTKRQPEGEGRVPPQQLYILTHSSHVYDTEFGQDTTTTRHGRLILACNKGVMLDIGVQGVNWSDSI